MRSWLLLVASLIALNSRGQTSGSKVWTELHAKRESLVGLHQEFEVTQTSKTAQASRGSHRTITIDISRGKWREGIESGSGGRIRIFDGQDLFLTEAKGDEYVRIKRKAKEEDPAPGPYAIDGDWAKAKEIERLPCGFSENDHQCVILEAPIRKWFRTGTNDRITRLSDGIVRLAIDTETGALIESQTQEVIEVQRGGYKFGYELDVKHSLKKMNYEALLDARLFELPESGVHEVKELTRWNADRIKKLLVGKPAPDLEVTDIRGNSVSLAGFKSKTVLLDFWATWCPPCLADGPALDKLYSKYGGKDLMIVGISVSEEREIVEKFLEKHPHNFPVVLTTENEMPRPYEIGIFPTYMVIAPDGTLTAAMEGDQGFGELRKILQKAGMETE